ncbi:MAG: Tad domain-containing protein [Vannielia sp.]|uniref:TadE/TadG family type IV pilus assembly protein n=1 Tax=Vannielia sp. TaxID=2813045 RepID=UPI003B8CA65C
MTEITDTKIKANRFTAFARDEDGGLIIFSLFLFVCMMLAVGISIDVMRTEMARTRLQNTADAAVLAAASMENTLSPEAVVNDYFTKAGLQSQLENVSVIQGVNHKTVTATTNTKLPMYFLGMVGIDKMEAKSKGKATAGYTDVEVSLVLDISASMGSNNRMANLQKAAREFVDTVIDPAQPGSVSLSLVPYTAQVNAGPAITDQLNVSYTHGYSHCVDFTYADFATTAINPGQSYGHMQHFQHQPATSNPIDNPSCPQQTYERITAFSENADALKAQITQLVPRHNTAIHLGMKWGVALLDPAFRPVVDQLIATGESDASFSGRPYAWNRDNTTKVIVLMTDGDNVDTMRIRDQYYDSTKERERWNSHAIYDYAQANGQNWTSYITTKYSASQADQMLSNVCSAAKDKGIVIFTIGLEVSTHGDGVMKNCASTPSHYFDVEGTEISDAFAAIARQISTLRLTN